MDIIQIHNKIKLLCGSKQISIKSLAIELGLTEQGFNKMFKKNSIKISQLDRIANILEVDICYFLKEDYENKPAPILPSQVQEPTYLYELLKSQSKIIENLTNKKLEG
jgi:transcriptional regulator with XRE-family HTH domain